MSALTYAQYRPKGKGVFWVLCELLRGPFSRGIFPLFARSISLCCSMLDDDYEQTATQVYLQHVGHICVL